MKKNLFTLVFFALSSLLFSQSVGHECGNHKIDSIRKSIDPEYKSRIMRLNNAINDYINTNYPDNAPVQSIMAVSPSAVYVIPVVVHIVLDPSDPYINNTTVSYAQVQSQIDALNAAFAKGYPTGPYAVDTKIQFCLAQIPMGIANWPDAGEPGVMRYDDAANSQNQLTIASTDNLINLTNGSGRFPFDNYLNIWVVNSIDGICSGVNGYAVNPTGSQFGLNGYNIDGVVIRADVFGDNSPGNNFVLQPHNLYGTGCPTFAQKNEGKVLVHEVGHYLNLFHTFQNDILTGATCAGNTALTCANEGDFCCDTPPSNTSSTFICGSSIPTTCGTTADMVENFMYYAYDACKNTFTDNQKTRMWACLNILRPNLFTVNNQIATGLIGPSGCLGSKLLADFTFAPSPICSNTPIMFSPIPFPVNTATTWNWTFTGGIPSSSSQFPVITFITPGNYDVTLTVSDGVNSPVSQTQTIFVSACTPIQSSQGNWYFGLQAGLSFASGLPVAVSNNPNPMSSYEPSSCISDANGNLMFYTDGFKAYNSNHTQATSNMWGSGTSAQTLIVPDPASPTNQFYVISLKGFVGTGNPFSNNFSYSHANVSGGVAAFNAINIPMPLPPGADGDVAEMVTAIPKCNGVDYWIIVHGSRNDPNANYQTGLFVYSLTNAGISTLIDVYPISCINTYGTIKASPDGKLIAHTSGSGYGGDTRIFDFDNSTGVISNPRLINREGYGISFSPNSKVLYITDAPLNTTTIYQYDLTNSNPGSTENFVGTYGNSSQLQLGPDNKIYAALYGQNHLAVINNPDVYNVTPNLCGYTYNGPVLSVGAQNPTCTFGLPNFIDAKPTVVQPSFTYVLTTSCNTVDFSSISCAAPGSIIWDFGDGSAQVTGANPSHTFSSPGPHIVTCTFPPSNVVQQTINIINPTTSITGPINVCVDNISPYIYNAPYVNGATYNWAISSNGTILNGNGSSQIEVKWNSGSSGNITLIITKDACTSNASLNVNLLPLPIVTAVASPANVCASSPNSVLTASGASDYVWNPGSISGNPITVNPTNTTVYTVFGIDANKCINSANVTVTYGPCSTGCANCLNPIGTSGQIIANVGGGSYCINNDVTVSGTKIFSNADIQMASGVKIVVLPGANLIIIHSHIYACSDMWKGIEVQSGGKVSVLNNSLIEDAIVAIDIKNSTVTNNLLRLTNSTFNKNYKAVYVENYNPVNNNYPFDITGCVFTSRDIYVNPASPLTWPTTSQISATAANPGAPLSSDIISNATYPPNTSGAFLKAPHNTQKSEMGIQLVNVGLTQGTEASPVFYEFKLGTAGSTKTNVFDNIRYELHAFNSNINSINNVYQNTAFVNRAFGGRGIIATCDPNFNGRLKVTKVTNSVNKFIDCGTAIQTVDYFIHEITENEIRSSKVNIAPNPPANFLGVNGVNILTNRFYNCTVNNNEIYNIENGIIFTSSNGAYNIYGLSNIGQYAKELNIVGNTISANLIGSSITTQYIKNAIVLQNLFLTGNGFVTRAPNLITVSTNQLTGVYRGISITNFGKIFQKINNNNIELVQDVFVANNTEYGINFNNNRAYQSSAYNKAVNNTITSYATSNPNNSAILFESSSGLTLGCNSVSNTYNGLHFNGTNFANAVYKNIMQGNQFGFVLNNNGIVGQDYAPTYFDIAIGEPNLPADNLWNGTWTGGKFKTLTINSSSQNSPMYVRNTTLQYNPDLSGFSIPPNTTNEYHNSNGSLPYAAGAGPTVCTFGTPAIVLNGHGNGLLSRITQDLVPLSGDIIKVGRVQKNHVFVMLKEDPSLMANSPSLQSFYNAALSTNNESFYNIEKQLADKDLILAQSNLNNVTLQDGVDDAYKTFSECALHFSQGTFNETDSSALHNLCVKCPYTDGLIIFQARTLYNMALGTVETFKNNCLVSGNARLSSFIPKSEHESSLYNVELFPNPTTNNFIISTVTETAELKVEILDVQGKLISSEIKNVSNYNVAVDTDLNNGVYFVNITDIASGNKTVKKLVVQK
ncbi:MAG: peptidase and matrixin and adamalysin [Bacteroidota bacterium]|jgi:PKD repeat protein|nr:peptidase and matrixin and adamalysin [Bacteroidota bacterium]